MKKGSNYVEISFFGDFLLIIYVLGFKPIRHEVCDQLITIDG